MRLTLSNYMRSVKSASKTIKTTIFHNKNGISSNSWSGIAKKAWLSALTQNKTVLNGSESLT